MKIQWGEERDGLRSLNPHPSLPAKGCRKARHLRSPGDQALPGCAECVSPVSSPHYRRGREWWQYADGRAFLASRSGTLFAQPPSWRRWCPFGRMVSAMLSQRDEASKSYTQAITAFDEALRIATDDVSPERGLSSRTFRELSARS